MLITADKSVLVLVDLQERLIPAIHQADAVIAECLRLANVARLLGVPVIGTEQTPAKLGANLEEIRRLCDRTVCKTHFDACADGLLEVLPPERRSIVVAGCEAHVCMLQTALGLLEYGHEVWVASDAVGSRRPGNRDAALERLRQKGAQLVTTEMVAFEWLRDSNHPRFREVLATIK